MNNPVLQAVIQEYGKELKVPTVVRRYPELARQARDGGWPYEEFLKQLLEAEVRERQDHCAERRIRQAGFPERKTLEQLDWTALLDRLVDHSRILTTKGASYRIRYKTVMSGREGPGTVDCAASAGA
ncbi:MAG: ATP-binding protein [bacterium]